MRNLARSSLVVLALTPTLLYRAAPAGADAQAERPRAGEARRRPGGATAEGAIDPARGPTPAAAAGVRVAPASSAPARPEQLTKTQPGEYHRHPGKRALSRLEDQIYQLEKPTSPLWGWADDREGRFGSEVERVERQLGELDARYAEAKAAAPDWHRFPEYDRHIAVFKQAAAAQRDHYAAIARAQDAAVAAAAAAEEAAWQAKRAKDDGPASDFARRAAGKVVVASAPHDPSGRGVVDALAVTSPVHLRAYFAESPWNALHTAKIDCSHATSPDLASLEGYWLRTWAKVGDGDYLALETLALDRAAFQRGTWSDLTTVTGSLSAGGAYGNADEQKAAMGWLGRVVGRLVPGVNRVTLQVSAWCYGAPHDGLPVATATIEVRASAAELAEVARRGRFALARGPLPRARLARWEKALAGKHGAQWALIDFRSAGDFALQRNALGVVLSRNAPSVAVLRHKAQPHRCELWSVELVEPFDGRRYGPQIEWQVVDRRPFVCGVS